LNKCKCFLTSFFHLFLSGILKTEICGRNQWKACQVWLGDQHHLLLLIYVRRMEDLSQTKYDIALTIFVLSYLVFTIWCSGCWYNFPFNRVPADGWTSMLCSRDDCFGIIWLQCCWWFTEVSVTCRRGIFW